VRRDLRPHVYETSALSYKGLAVDGVDQSVLVSGESGAGKTETVKICMNHMASLQRGPVEAGTKREQNIVVQRVVDSNPLLEAFGNAKTRRNDNSSRFGKYIQLQFDRQEPTSIGGIPPTKLAGSKCDVYLLEKSRITSHDDSERTYHIFYQIIASKDKDKTAIWRGLQGSKCSSFKYVGKEFELKIDGMTDDQHYYETVESLASIGVTGDKLMTLMRAITTTMALGNITFGPKAGDSEASEVTSRNDLAAASDIIGIPAADLELAFVERTMITRGETFKVPLKADGAKDSCDAFAKEIYSKVFLWLVREINESTVAEKNYEGDRKTDFGIIGLLDIFGFESFPVNGFEQLAINYANEKLQQKFTKDIFQTVQEEYRFEGISLHDIRYDDNADVLALIEGRAGLLAMLNEECVRPMGSDKEFVYKAIQGNKASPCLIADKLLGPMDFGIHHYAGKVVYYADGFIARNLDTIAADLIAIAKKSTNYIIANHLQNEKMMNGEAVVEPQRQAPKRGKSNITNDTLWTKFKNQLTALMKSLNETQSRYIRCVKPNTHKLPGVMQHMTTIEQLRCAGVVAAVTISRSAFPNRLDHRACLDRFKVLNRVKKKKMDPREEVEAMLKSCLGPIQEKSDLPVFVVGKTRVYFKMGVLEFLEGERMRGFDQWAYDIQRCTRGWLIRKENGGLKMMSKGPRIIPIQCWWRCLLARKQLKKLKKAKKAQRKAAKKQFKAAIKIQALVRGFLWRPKFREMVKDKREKESTKRKIKELESTLRDLELQRQREVAEAREAAEKEMDEYRIKMKKELGANKETAKKAAQQQTLIDESGKIIEYLRKENTKLRNQNETMRKDFRALKENNQRLIEANASAGESFSALNEHAKQLNATNAKLIKNIEAYKKQLEKLKDDLKTRQAYYLAEAEARLAYQKTMAQIVGAVQDKCRDPQLVEDVVIMALECEAEAKSERAALEGRKTQASTPSSTKASSSAQYADDDSDSDSD
jgi:myosin-5